MVKDKLFILFSKFLRSIFNKKIKFLKKYQFVFYNLYCTENKMALGNVRLSYAVLKTIKSFVVFIFEHYQYSSASDYRDMKDVLNGVSFHENLKL